MQDYYPGEYYAIPTIGSLERLASREQCKINAIKRFVMRGRLLEIGPAFGTFALRARQEGFEVTCIERDARCRDYLESSVGVHAIGSSNPAAVVTQLPSFDVIALWQVIEHLDRPLALLDILAGKLTAGGILALSTPNPESFQFARMGKRWPHVDAPRHLHLLPASLLIERMQAHGFETCLLDSNDADAKSWNRFGWQRLIMNRFGGPLGNVLGIAAGRMLSVMFQPLESAAMRGSTYTLVMRKKAA